VADALYNKGVALGQIERREEAIAAYEEVVSRFSDDPAPAIKELVAKAIVNEGPG
jgi:hypothetical protein